MAVPVIAVRPANRADLDFVFATERLPGYDELVGRTGRVQHESFLEDGRHAYFLGEEAGRPVGFVIVRDWNAADGCSLVKRVAVTEPGRGIGRAMLAAVIDRVFADSPCYRLEIGLFPSNERARRTYEAAGFTVEGIARGRVFMGGAHHDEMVMSMLRPDWEARRQRLSPPPCGEG